MTINSDYYQHQIVTQMASLSVLPFWYPFFARSVYQRAQILYSRTPGDLSHSTFFNNRFNYYRGITANVFMQPLFPLTDWMFEHFTEGVRKLRGRDPNAPERIGIGFLVGASTVALANPYEVTVIASQEHREPPRHAFKRVMQRSGIQGFYTGAVPMGVRNGIFMSSLYVLVPIMQGRLQSCIPGSGKAHELATTVLASIIPATGYTCLAVQLDLAAIMRQSDPPKKVYKSTLHAMKAAYEKHGAAALKAGLKNRLIACVIEMAGFHLFRNALSKR